MRMRVATVGESEIWQMVASRDARHVESRLGRDAVGVKTSEDGRSQG